MCRYAHLSIMEALWNKQEFLILTVYENNVESLLNMHTPRLHVRLYQSCLQWRRRPKNVYFLDTVQMSLTWCLKDTYRRLISRCDWILSILHHSRVFFSLKSLTIEMHSYGISDSTSYTDHENEQGSCHIQHLETKCFPRQLCEARVASNLAPTGSIL